MTSRITTVDSKPIITSKDRDGLRTTYMVDVGLFRFRVNIDTIQAEDPLAFAAAVFSVREPYGAAGAEAASMAAKSFAEERHVRDVKARQ